MSAPGHGKKGVSKGFIIAGLTVIVLVLVLILFYA